MKNIIASFALVVLICSLTSAFDTGYHFDLTRSVLNERGFSDQAIKIVQVENWLTDYYASSPTARGAARDDLEKLHFDNLFSTAETTRYWNSFVSNVREATRKAAADDDVLEMLTTIGIALHATQDFYTHSNWVEAHPRLANGPYRTDTFLAAGPLAGTELVTGKYPEDRKGSPTAASIHGNYTTGMNHDSQIRPRWDEAYVFAYCGSHELMQLIESWAEEARPGFLRRVKAHSVSANDLKDLEYDLRAVRNMSMWISAKDEDGHWKGNLSGSSRFFDAFSSKWVSKSSSIFVRQISERKLQKRLAANLYTSINAPVLSRPAPFSLRRNAIILRFTKISEQDEGRFSVGIDPGGNPDFYSIVTVGQQEYIERVLQGKKELSDPWFIIHFVDVVTLRVPLKIELWDEDDTDADGKYKDDHIDINPLPNKRDAEFVFRPADKMLDGEVLEVHPVAGPVFTLVGEKPDNNRATLAGYIKAVPLK